MARRVVIVVLDGLGIGAMDDVAVSRPQDAGANTLLHVLERWEAVSGESLRTPALSSLGLDDVLAGRDGGPSRLEGSAAGKARLGYPGADTYIAHQVLMGSDASDLLLEPFSAVEERVAAALRRRGHDVRRALPDLPVLLVDERLVVGDNLEADPGLNYNVTGSLDETDFDHVVRVASELRAEVTVGRVIAVGGRGLDTPGLVDCVEARERGEVAGIDTPATGFYRRGGLEVLHLGFAQTQPTRQLPSLAAEAGMDVTLIGKMADVIECKGARRLPAVETAEVLANTLAVLREQRRGLVAVNVQEMDLAGHQQDPEQFARILAEADRGVGELLALLQPGDLLLVLGDHGNDPTIGHPGHTREHVPLLAYQPAAGVPGSLGERATIADVGATAALALGLPHEQLEAGRPFLEVSEDAAKAG